MNFTWGISDKFSRFYIFRDMSVSKSLSFIIACWYDEMLFNDVIMHVCSSQCVEHCSRVPVISHK